MFDPSTKMKCMSLALLKTSVPDDPKAFLAFGCLHTQTIKNKSKSFQGQAFTVQHFLAGVQSKHIQILKATIILNLISEAKLSM